MPFEETQPMNATVRQPKLQGERKNSSFFRKNGLIFLTLLSLALFLLHIYFAFIQPNYSFPDDTTYVSAAVHILTGKQCATVVENPCNYEHPPLSKLLL